MSEPKKIPRWYHGGVASAIAVCFTHPLDLIKVLIQTQSRSEGKLPIMPLISKVAKEQGILAFYNGLSASVGRQLSYSTLRFALYEIIKSNLGKTNFFINAAVAGTTGAIGGLAGTPFDVVNVRMQNDIKLPLDKRRNYKHVIDGLIKTYQGEGMKGLMAGGSAVAYRCGLMTAGQLAVYDLIKGVILNFGLKDGTPVYLMASSITGVVATTITQPLDVMKTVKQNAKAGEFSGNMALIKEIAKSGPLGFFKGYVPAFTRIGPQTILVFLFYEFFKDNFGIVPESAK